jgi:hypothetical protein
MKTDLSLTVLFAALCAIFLGAAISPAQKNRQNDTPLIDGTFKGTLHAGKTGSYLVYVGEETGDFAAFCFLNNSKPGRTILSACKNGDTCQFSGMVDQSKSCKVDAATRKVLSGSGRILTVSSARSLSQAKSGNAATPMKSPYLF